MLLNLTNKKLPLFIAVFIVLSYLCFVMYHTVNVLFADDIHLLETVLWMEQSPSWAERYHLIMLQHNEHRIVVPRLLAWAVYKTQGEVYWPTLIFIGNAAWCAVCLIIWKFFKNLQLSYWFFLPIPLLIYQPQYVDNLTWSISVLQQSGIVFLYLLIIYLVSKNKLILPLILACVATFTHGSGIFAFLIITILLIIKQQWKSIGICLGVGLVMAAWFFTDYAGGQSANIPESLSNPARLFGSAMAFLGASLTAFDRYGLSVVPTIVMGVVIMSIVAFFVFKTWEKRTEPSIVFLYGCVLFIGLTVALVAVSRSWQGIEAIIAPRYIHYSPLAIALAYLMLLYLYPNKSQYLAIIVFGYALVFNFISYYKYTPEVILKREALKADIYNWNHHQLFLSNVFQFNWNIRPIISDAEKNGFSTLSKYNWEIPTSQIDSTLRFNLTYYTAGKLPFCLITNDVLDDKGFLVLEAEDKSMFVCGIAPRPNPKSVFFKTLQYNRPGFQVQQMIETLKKGKYRIGLYQNQKLSMSNQYLERK